MIKTMIVEGIHETSEWMAGLIDRAFPDAYTVRCHSISDAQEQVKILHPALVLLDLNLPDGNGLNLIPVIRKQSPDIHVVVMTIFDDSDHLFPALRAGASGYLLKDQPEDLLTAQLHGLIKGAPPLSPSIARKILMHFSSRKILNNKLDIVLAERDEEILVLVSRGMNRSEIGEILSLSPHTVARYIKDVYKKLDVNSRAEAAVMACRIGLINIH
ncbi:MAG: DNA-binding response regulator [Thiothrix sp.]|nr:MAG: DNA-binding response regulator [Thiothrix sp.]